MSNIVGNTVHYGETALIIRLKTLTPAHLHHNIAKGISAALKLSLLAEDLTKEEREGLLALQEMAFQMIPSELHYDKAYGLTNSQAFQ